MAVLNQRVAVIGCGYWGKNLCRTFAQIGVLAAIVDSDEQVVSRISQLHNVPGRTLNEVLADETITAVIVATPAEQHASVALEAFAAKKHVFVEKPIALSIDDAEKMIAASKKHQRILMVGHLLQYHPTFLRLKEMVEQGVFGKLRYIYSRRLNIGKMRVHENVLWSFAPHDLSMILALVGSEPVKTKGFAGNFLQESVSDFASVHMEFANGTKAHVEVSWLNPFKEQRLIIAGEKLMAEFDDQADWDKKLKIYNHRAEIINGEPVLEPGEVDVIATEPYEPLRNECEHFLKYCESGETPITDGAEALRVLKVLHSGDAA